MNLYPLPQILNGDMSFQGRHYKQKQKTKKKSGKDRTIQQNIGGQYINT